MFDQGRLLYETVLAYPLEDGPRLVLADWWEEHGQCARAEFCRVQCKAAENTHEFCRPDYCVMRDGPPCEYASARQRAASLLAATTAEPCPRCNGDYMRILYESDGNSWRRGLCHCQSGRVQVPNCVRWAGKLGGQQAQPTFTTGSGKIWHGMWATPNDSSWSPVAFRFVRGFIGSVSLSCAALVGERCPECARGSDCHRAVCDGSGYVGGVAGELARFPLTEVRLSDKRPFGPADGSGGELKYGLFDESRTDVTGIHSESDLPTVIFDALSGGTSIYASHRSKWYASASAAEQALSAACVRLVREQAKNKELQCA